MKSFRVCYLFIYNYIHVYIYIYKYIYIYVKLCYFFDHVYNCLYVVLYHTVSYQVDTTGARAGWFVGLFQSKGSNSTYSGAPI